MTHITKLSVILLSFFLWQGLFGDCLQILFLILSFFCFKFFSRISFLLRWFVTFVFQLVSMSGYCRGLMVWPPLLTPWTLVFFSTFLFSKNVVCNFLNKLPVLFSATIISLSNFLVQLPWDIWNILFNPFSIHAYYMSFSFVWNNQFLFFLY